MSIACSTASGAPGSDMGIDSYVVRSGDMRDRVTFQTKQVRQSPMGQAIETWSDAFSCWADVDPLSGRELIAAQQVQSTVTHTVGVRYRKELANPTQVANMRIVFRGRFFNIHACMDQSSRQRKVVLLVEEGLNDG